MWCCRCFVPGVDVCMVVRGFVAGILKIARGKERCRLVSFFYESVMVGPNY